MYLIINLILFFKNKTINKKVKSENNENKTKLIREKEIINENKSKIEKEIKELKELLNNKNKLTYNLIRNNYNKIDEYVFNNLINIDLKEIETELDIERNRYDSLKIQLNTIDIEERTIDSALEKKVLYEEELANLEEQRKEVLELEKNINLAKETLEIAYNKIKEQVTPKFTKQLSKLMEQISDGKYKNVSFSDEYGLRVELDSGKYVDSSLLSLGTIDQLYLSLRLSAIREISEERIPIILDEAFVYYDKERLKNILKYIDIHCKDFQIIILSCSNREKDIMDECDISYNFVEL